MLHKEQHQQFTTFDTRVIYASISGADRQVKSLLVAHVVEGTRAYARFVGYHHPMPVHPRSLDNLLPMPRLESGVTSEVHRVRADAEVNSWFSAMSAAQRGEVLARARAAEGAAGGEVAEGAPAGPEVAQRPAGAPVAVPVLRPRLTGRAAALLAHLEGGAELVSGGGMFRVVLGGQVVQSYAPAVARRVLDVPGLLREVGPERWALA